MHLLKKITWFCLVMVALHHFCRTQTDGFSRVRIEADLPEETLWQAVEIPDQPFYYLGCGAQTFAFVSQDGQYVIKFYRHHRAGHPLAILSPYVSRLRQTISRREAKRAQDFESFRLAIDKLREETGLLCVHLGKTDQIHKKLKIYDKIGIEHLVELDQITFLLQRRATPFYTTLQQWIDSGSEREAKAAITELVSLLRGRCKKGIFDKDPDLQTNFGFLDGHPIQFDVGRFKNQPEIIEADELVRITDSLKGWLNQKAPDLVSHLEKELHEKI